MSELKPCPFCGKKVRLMWFDEENQSDKCFELCDEDNREVFCFVYCVECDLQAVFSTPTNNAESIVEAWNRRAE